MIKFLNVTPVAKRLQCAIQEYPAFDNTGVRTVKYSAQRVYLTHDPFTPEMRVMIDSYIQRVNASLAAHRQTVMKEYKNDYW